VGEAADKEQWQCLHGWLSGQAPAPVLIVLENAEDCIALPFEDTGAALPMSEVRAWARDLHRITHCTVQ